MRRDHRYHRENPTFEEKMHIIIYTVKAVSIRNNDDSLAMRIMKKIRQERKGKPRYHCII